MPFGHRCEFATFEDCINEQIRLGKSAESARRICGALKRDTEGKCSRKNMQPIQVKNSGSDTAEVMIYDQIGEDWFSEGVTAKRFADDLKALGRLSRIDVRINSPGGSVFDGMAIYNTLKNNGAKVRCKIEGAALSIASVIAMVGDEIWMAENGLMMLHNPSGFCQGESSDMRKLAEVLDKIAETIRDVYASRSGMTPEEVTELMNHETWLTAKDAMAKKLVTKISENQRIAACFDLTRFKNAPQKTFGNKADSDPEPKPEPEPDPVADPKEPTMSKLDIAALNKEFGLELKDDMEPKAIADAIKAKLAPAETPPATDPKQAEQLAALAKESGEFKAELERQKNENTKLSGQVQLMNLERRNVEFFGRVDRCELTGRMTPAERTKLLFVGNDDKGQPRTMPLNFDRANPQAYGKEWEDALTRREIKLEAYEERDAYSAVPQEIIPRTHSGDMLARWTDPAGGTVTGGKGKTKEELAKEKDDSYTERAMRANGQKRKAAATA